MNDNVPSCGNLPAVKPKNLTNAPANAIAPDGIAQRAADADAEPRSVEPIRAKMGGKPGARAALAAAIDGFEIACTKQAPPAAGLPAAAGRPAMVGKAKPIALRADPVPAYPAQGIEPPGRLAGASAPSRARRGGSSDGRGPVVRSRIGRTALDRREPVTPFSPPPGKDLPPSFGLHPRTKPVGFVAMADMGLIGAFWQPGASSDYANARQ
jgi:hypothetical protein